MNVSGFRNNIVKYFIIDHIACVAIVMMMSPLRFLHQWLFLMILLFSTCTNSAFMLHKTPRLSPLGPKVLRHDHPSNNIPSDSSLASLKDFESYFYEQTLDHFNYGLQSYATFKQKYVINSKYWGGAKSNAPIFAYLGAESPLANRTLLDTGSLTDNAPHFKALLIYIEHRFYGDSIPFGSNEEDFLKNETLRGYFNSAQAIADYAEILLHVKQIVLSAPNSPIIVVGGSYGGMLAAWFRLKYPHIAIGALASSAPILYFDNITPQDAYGSIVEKDFKDESESCFNTIRKSWDVIYKLASKPNGLSILSRKLKTCSTLENIEDLRVYIGWAYSVAAQYNAPPDYPVKTMCDAIDGAAIGTDVLGRISAAMNSFAVTFGFNSSCNHISGSSNPKPRSWDWQTCSEMVMPIGSGSDNVTITREKPFSLEQKIKECKKLYGVAPRPHWVTTYYGGHDIKMVLRKFGSNIIFSNGLRDPYSGGGVLEDLSDSLPAIYTENGSHCLDIQNAKETDPEWLVKQRKIEVQIMEGWIANYYAHLIVTN